MSRTPLRGVRRLFAVLATVLTAGALTVPAAHADNPALVITASVGAEPQLIGKPFPVTLTLTNPTDQPLTKVTVWDEHLSGSWLSVQDWAGLGGSQQAGVPLDAGATRTFTITAVVWNWNSDVPHERFRADWSQGGDLAVPLLDPTTTHGSASGVVYGDRNENGVFDAGEGLPGAIVYVSGSGGSIETTTDADGRYTFTDLPARRYWISAYNLPGGWVPESGSPQYADVDGSDPGPAVPLRGLRPFSEKVHATGSFDRTTYQVGDPVQVTFTLTNVSGSDVHGISLGCDRFGSADHLLGWTGWADIATPGSFDLAAGQTRTFTETGTVPTVAPTYGSFYLACDFGPEPGGGEGLPAVTLFAHVPAPPAGTAGLIYHDDNNNYTVDPGEPITGATVELVDRVDGSVTATAVSDEQGHVAFGSVPAGPYDVRVDGWQPVDGEGGTLFVGTCSNCGQEWDLRYRH